MAWSQSLLVLICFNILSIYEAKKYQLPNYLKQCSYKLSNQEMAHCMGNTFEHALNKLKNGDKSIDLPSIDPMFIPSIDIMQNPNSPVSISIHHKNLKIIGMSRSKTVNGSFEFNKATGSLTTKTTLAKLTLEGEYELKGKILLLVINGKGRCTIDLYNNLSTLSVDGKIINKNGKPYIEYGQIKHTIEPQTVHLNFENIFPGDEGISRNINKVLNENWKEILKEIKPAYELVFGQVFTKGLQGVFHNIPATEIFPDFQEPTNNTSIN